MTEKRRIRTLIIDDSPIVRRVFSALLTLHPEIEIIGEAADAYEARNLIVQLKPDVITLDLEMPKMDGLEFISVLMEHWPLPIVVVSSLTPENSQITLQALESGAVEVLHKPGSRELEGFIPQLKDAIIYASQANIRRYKPSTLHTPIAPITNLSKNAENRVIAIGASTGGTEAVLEVLQYLPGNLPGIVIVQHMPKLFTTGFAERLNRICDNLTIKEATSGSFIAPGSVLIAPGDQHLLVKAKDSKFYTSLNSKPPISGHRPSVDMLFSSVAESAGKDGLGILLTGMGKDGAKGLLAMHMAGSKTIGQDEESCVVYGMPKEAALMGAVDDVLPLDQIAKAMCKWSS